MTPTSEQLANARTILDVGSSVGANAKQLLAAIETALVESGLRNLSYGDRDSLGVFQQRPSMGWGSQSQVMDLTHAARSFFTGAGSNKGALQVSQSGSAGNLAQRVQRSAFPARYDQREADAVSIINQLSGGGYAGDNFFGVPVSYDADAITEPSAYTTPQSLTLAATGISTAAVAAVAVGALLLYLLIDD